MNVDTLESKAAVDVSSYDSSIGVVSATETHIRSILGRHESLVPPQVVDQIARKEAVVALQVFGERVLSRRETSDIHGPGIIIYVPKGYWERLIETNEIGGLSLGNNQPLADTLHTLILPEGGCSMNGAWCQLYQEVPSPWVPGSIDLKPHLLIQYDDLVRIEGFDKRVWQNRNYNWDGTPKLKQP